MMHRNQNDTLPRSRLALEQIADFIEPYLPLANAHNTDFIVKDHWHRLVPSVIQRELLDLTDTELAQLPVNTQSAPSPAPCHPSTSSSPSLPKPLPHEDYEKKTAMTTKKRCQWDLSQLPNWQHNHLQEFVAEANIHNLIQLGISTTLQELGEKWQIDMSGGVFVGTFMSPKKEHEVEIMAAVCAALASAHRLSKVVDIGSGRGYLSCHLAKLHRLQVLGIDSSTVNTHSAELRSTRLSKHWNGLLRNAQIQQNETKDKLSKKEKQKLRERLKNEERENKPEAYHSNNGAYVPITLHVTQQTDIQGLLTNSFTESETTSIGGTVEACKHNPLLTCDRDVSQQPSDTHGVNALDNDRNVKVSDMNRPVNMDSKRSLVPAQIEYGPTGNIEQASLGIMRKVTDHMKELAVREGDESSNDIVCELNDCDIKSNAKSSCTHQHIASEDDTGSKSKEAEVPSAFMLTGLHTCGDLAASMLHLFVSKPGATAVCNVGCCYHHIEEEFVKSPYATEDDAEPEEFGFPLSSSLKKRNYRLGRNARMLACQAVPRVAHNVQELVPYLMNLLQLPSYSLHYRAMLQKILLDSTGMSRDDWHVGRIAAKCADFKQYVYKSFKKLDVEAASLSDDLITSYQETYAASERQLQAFFQLKMVLAPCIEALILLDRLVFLLEQECVAGAHIVQMFDPVTSPRSHGIIAWKEKT